MAAAHKRSSRYRTPYIHIIYSYSRLGSILYVAGSESDPEEELEQLRRQVRARVKATAWGRGGGGADTGVAALERRLRGGSSGPQGRWTED